jgi:ubiquinone/menaquinone biosynthesis C-methylase UbiE
MANERPQYVLGDDPEELARLDHQARVLAPSTRLILRQAGLAPGMRVLDLGTGTGEVARLAAEIVGPEGRVIGVDRSPGALEVAERRCRAAGLNHVSFVEGDVRAWVPSEAFDAIVARLLLFHLPQPVEVIAHYRAAIAPGGRFLVMDFDIGGARSSPPTPVFQTAVQWIRAAFAKAGADPLVGAKLGRYLRDGGFPSVTMIGLSSYLSWDDGDGPLMIAGILRTLWPVIEKHGIASQAEGDPSTVTARIQKEIEDAKAVIVPPTLVGAWATIESS